MLEAFALLVLTNAVGILVGHRGYRADWFMTLAMGLWFGGELAGAVAGIMDAPFSGWLTFETYLRALLGAGLGAAIALAATLRPALVYRWWRIVAGLLSVAAFLFAMSADTALDGYDGLVGLTFIFIAVILGVTLHQDVLDKRGLRAVLLAVAISGWLLFAFVYLRMEWEYEMWLSDAAVFILSVSGIAILWSAIDPILNRRPLPRVAVPQPPAQPPAARQVPDAASAGASAAASQVPEVPGTCPKCGSAVAATDTNCPSCRVNLAFALQHPEQL